MSMPFDSLLFSETVDHFASFKFLSKSMKNRLIVDISTVDFKTTGIVISLMAYSCMAKESHSPN